jgi:hypothetical protein
VIVDGAVESEAVSCKAGGVDVASWMQLWTLEHEGMAGCIEAKTREGFGG